MSNETLAGMSLPPRANVALLTLQMRAAIQEATAAEAAASAMVDTATAEEELRVRLEPLVTERRNVLLEALAKARTDADTEVAAARRAAAVMRQQRSLRDAVPVAPVAAADPLHASSRHATSPIEVAASEADGVSDEEPTDHKWLTRADAEVPPANALLEQVLVDTTWRSVEVKVTPESPSEPSVSASDLATSLADADPATSTVRSERTNVIMPFAGAVPTPTANVVIDAEAFARVFATVLASLLDERLGSSRAIAPPPLAPAKQSFWTHARHPDVLLMSLTMLIVLVVLAAWLV